MSDTIREVREKGDHREDRFLPRESLLTQALAHDASLRATFSLLHLAIAGLALATLVRYSCDRRLAREDLTFLLNCFNGVHVSLCLDAIYLILFLLLAPIERSRRLLASKEQIHLSVKCSLKHCAVEALVAAADASTPTGGPHQTLPATSVPGTTSSSTGSSSTPTSP